MTSPHRTFGSRHAFTAILFVTLLVCDPIPIDAAAVHPGKWTPADSVGDVAVHLALLPSPSSGSYHSKIVFWNHGHRFGQPDAFAGKVWNWSPTVQDACGSWPASNFAA